jgi:hypothetical protein
MATYELTVLPGLFVVSRLAADAPLPAWATASRGLFSITRTDDELSVIALEGEAPGADPDAPRWRALKVHGPFPLDTVGVLASVSASLAHAGISLLAVSTHDTDYLFVRMRDLAHAVRALRHDGHAVHTSA